jgi:hypothetical protein
MFKIPWKKIVVVGSVFLLGVSTGLGMAMVTDPTFNPTFAPNISQKKDDEIRQMSLENTAAQVSGQLGGLTEAEQAKIVDDYKLSLALLFEAWRSPDMETFEKKLLGGYAGDIKDRHADRAQAYISSGKGLYVDDLKFDAVRIESANASAAILMASYTYTARDFDLDRTQAYGQKVDHQVHVRVDLITIGDRWMISGEYAI